MYLNYFGLKESPFSIAPDPAFLYLSSGHERALEFLATALDRGGVWLLSGDIGAGKTTLCRTFLGQLPAQTELALVLNPCVSADELLEVICDELSLGPGRGESVFSRFLLIKKHLARLAQQRRRLVLVIDEAQGLFAETYEQLRQLAKFTVGRWGSLAIVLIGQPELTERCRQFPAFEQQITARYHLASLGCEDAGAYVRHRLQVAGCDRELFGRAALAEVMRQTDGVPRLINLVCDHALLAAATRYEAEVSVALVREAAAELLGPSPPARRKKLLLVASIGLTLLAALLWQLLPYRQDTSLVVSAVAAPAHAVAMAPVSASAPALFNRWPGSFAFSVSREQAFADLFDLWQLPQDGRQLSPCAFGRRNNLDCYAKKVTLSNLAGLNRPAILTLYRDSGDPFYVVLAGLEGREARLLAAGQQLVLDIQALESRWFGECLLLWRAPQTSSGLLRPGETSVLVVWLEDRLIELGLYCEENPTVRLEGRLLTALKRFQSRAGLVSDGILGPETMIHLASAGGDAGPRLHPLHDYRGE
jgi:general secretion pathway protein A